MGRRSVLTAHRSAMAPPFSIEPAGSTVSRKTAIIGYSHEKRLSMSDNSPAAKSVCFEFNQIQFRFQTLVGRISNCTGTSQHVRA